MNNLFVVIIAVVLLTAMVWWFRRSRASDRFAVLMKRHAATETLTSRAQLIDGANHIVVALTLDPQRILYANDDLDAAIDIRQIDEVEYGSDLVTGGIADGAVLRLRAHGRAIEFVLDSASAERWSRKLPPHRINQTGTVHAV